MNDTTATAGVIARPIRLFPIALLIGLAADRFLPRPFATPGPGALYWIAGGAMVVAGFAFMRAGIRNFSQAETPVPTNEPARVLVTTGIHGRTRNPIYAGMFLIYIGAAVAAQSAYALLLTLPLAVTMRYGVIAREEAYLEQRFGGAYRDYKGRVRRWL